MNMVDGRGHHSGVFVTARMREAEADAASRWGPGFSGQIAASLPRATA